MLGSHVRRDGWASPKDQLGRDLKAESCLLSDGKFRRNRPNRIAWQLALLLPHIALICLA